MIWGGIGHEPVTLGTFWRSFYSISDTNGGEKFSRKDPGARFSSVDFSWRLPFLNHWLTLYNDSEVHDDVFPLPHRVMRLCGRGCISPTSLESPSSICAWKASPPILTPV